MSTCLTVLAARAICECVCSTLYKLFELVGILPMILPVLFLIMQDFSLKVTVLPVLVIQPMDTIVSAISGAWRVL